MNVILEQIWSNELGGRLISAVFNTATSPCFETGRQIKEPGLRQFETIKSVEQAGKRLIYRAIFNISLSEMEKS